MPDAFPYDLFLSHSGKDKAVVRPLAERLRADGPPAKVEGRSWNSSFFIHPSSFALCVRLGLGAVGGRHVWEGQLALFAPRDAEIKDPSILEQIRP